MQSQPLQQPRPAGMPAPHPDDFTKHPGFYQRGEIPMVIKHNAEFYIEPAGKLTDATELYTVYFRAQRGRRLP